MSLATNESQANEGTEAVLPESEIRLIDIFNSDIQPYLALTLCIIGSIFNVLNIIVYTRKNSPTNKISPINRILTFLAIADLFVLLFYILRLCYNWFLASYVGDSFGGDLLFFGNIYVIVYFANVSTWLTVTVSVFRLISVVYPIQSSHWCSLKTTRVVVTVILIVSFLFQLTDYLFVIMAAARTYKIEAFQTMINIIGFNDDEVENNAIRVYTIVMSVVFRILPSILIAVFSCRLALTLKREKKISRSLTGESTKGRNKLRNGRSTSRRTLTLLVLSLVSLVTLAPRGVVAMIYIFNEEWFVNELSAGATPICDILTLINATFPFLVYYSIGTNFRFTVEAIFCRKLFRRVSKVSTVTERTNRTDSFLNSSSNQ